MASSQTSNYGLNQWAAEDKVLREEFNQDNAKLETALGDKGNCRIATGSYVGTGEYGEEHPNIIQLPFPAQIIFLDVLTKKDYNFAPQHFILFRDASSFPAYNTTNGINVLSWADRSVSWYYTYYDSEAPMRQFNESGKTYHYIIMG